MSSQDHTDTTTVNPTTSDTTNTPPPCLHPSYDILVVNNDGIIDIQSEDDTLVVNDGSTLENIGQQLFLNTTEPQPNLTASVACAHRTYKSQKPDLAHSPKRLQEIEIENKSLLRRLLNIVHSKPKANSTVDEHDRRLANAKSSSVRRKQAKDDKIMEENIALYNRLQAVKPSAAVNKQKQEEEFRTSQHYMDHMRKSKPNFSSSRPVSSLP